MIDISEKELELVIEILKVFVSNCEIRFFGSRFKHTSKKYSDLDIAIKGSKVINWETIQNIKEAFQESDLPFRVDIIDWNNTEDYFKNIILESGYETIVI